MTDLQRDPIINAIQNGIKRDIEVALTNERYRAATILIYAGMDAMAFLNMPAGHTEVSRNDFIRWAERYIRFPCREQLTGADLYGARCAMLHAYGVVSRMSRAGECRMIGYMDQSLPQVRYNPSVAPDLVLVSISALKEAFFKGIDSFLVEAFADRGKAPIIEKRLQTFIHIFPAR